jgi:cytochrome c5
LVEYGDYQCPFCGAAYPIVNELLRRRPDTARLVYRHFPLQAAGDWADLHIDMRRPRGLLLGVVALSVATDTVSVWLIYAVRERLRRGFARASVAWGDMTSVLADTIPGIRVVKAFAQESREVDRFVAANDRVLDANDRVNVVWSFTGPIVSLISEVGLLVVWACGAWLVFSAGVTVGAGSDTLSPEATAKRIAPVARLDLVDASGPKVYKTGEQVYKAVCAGCHIAGVAGALKFGDTAAWSTAIGTGLSAMVTSVVKGKGAMPAKGGNPALDDYEIARAVVYMTNSAGGKFEEPAAPAPQASAAK